MSAVRWLCRMLEGMLKEFQCKVAEGKFKDVERGDGPNTKSAL